jgi:periplasmic protein TonB
MWEETLIESRRKLVNGKKWFALPFSFAAHALLMGGLIGVGYWSVEAVSAPPSRDPIVTPVIIDGGGMPAATHASPRQSKSSDSPPLLQNQIIPEIRNDVAIIDLAPSVSTNNIEDGPGISGPGAGNGRGTGNGQGPGTSSSTGADILSDHPVTLTPDIRQPVLIRKVEPPYPVIAMRSRIQGVVILQAVITKKGTVQDVALLRSAHALLDEAAIAAVKQWIYEPALLNNKPISVYFRVTVEFRLQ